MTTADDSWRRRAGLWLHRTLVRLGLLKQSFRTDQTAESTDRRRPAGSQDD